MTDETRHAVRTAIVGVLLVIGAHLTLVGGSCIISGDTNRTWAASHAIDFQGDLDTRVSTRFFGSQDAFDPFDSRVQTSDFGESMSFRSDKPNNGLVLIVR